MVFLIQSTQNRDAEAMQVKLDEIIRAIGHAKNELLDLEELEEEDLDEMRRTYQEMARKARGDRGQGEVTRGCEGLSRRSAKREGARCEGMPSRSCEAGEGGCVSTAYATRAHRPARPARCPAAPG